MRIENIRELRFLLGISQVELAKLFGITQGAVSKWERGEHRLSARNIFKLQKLCKEYEEVEIEIDLESFFV